MIKPLDGEVVLDKGEKISYVPSEFFSANMKVTEIFFAGNRKGNIKDYLQYAETLGIKNFLERDFSTLSSGEKRLVMICKALAEGNVVLMDEPLSNLDVSNKYGILRLISELEKDGKTFLLTSHELDVIEYASQVMVMKKGKLRYIGNPKELSEEILSEVYKVKVKTYLVDGKLFFRIEG